jgi:hypothetical protein
MRTVKAGIEAARRAPLAFAPYCAEAALAGLLVMLGALPAAPASATATGILPVGIYHDVKQSLAFSSGWSWVGASVAVGVAFRSIVFAATLWLADGARGPFVVAWGRSALIALVMGVAFLPVAGLHFIGAAIRYAPFTWIAGLMGVLVAVIATRVALRVDAGAGFARRHSVPAMGALLAYAYVFSVAALVLWMVSGSGPWASALVLLALGPFNAVVVLGWRTQTRGDAAPEPRAAVVALTGLAVVALFAASAYDRYVVDVSASSESNQDLSLFILGGVDSTSKTGALTAFDGRVVGVQRDRVTRLSYRDDGPYAAIDTHRDPDDVARVIAAQISEAEGPRAVLGHSQSAVIMDRVIEQGTMPSLEVSISGPPAYPPFWPPRLTVPDPGEPGPGVAAGDVARAYSSLFETLGLQGFDIDAGASPTNLEPVVPCSSSCPIPRMNVWALGDAVWLDRDWRRPGEINIIVASDHVGAVRNGRALEAARLFLAGEEVQPDEGPTWQGTLVHVLRFAFEPWRPGR